MGGRGAQVTRIALERAFDQLFLQGGYASGTPACVAQSARVGRSTFYEHFSGRDDILAHRLTNVLQPLAKTVSSEVVPEGLEHAVAHFWAHRVTTRQLLVGHPRRVVMQTLTTLISRELANVEEGANHQKRPALRAAYIAGGQLALLEEWLGGRHHYGAAVIADVLHVTSFASRRATEKSLPAVARGRGFEEA